MGTGELNESKHINKPVPGGTVIPQYPYIYIFMYELFIHVNVYLQLILGRHLLIETTTVPNLSANDHSPS